MSYSSEVLADSPLAYYRLGDSSGTTMADASGNSRSGTYTGMTLGAPGAVSGDTAVTTNGVGSGVAGSTTGSTARGVVTGASWMDAVSWTVEIWAKYGSGNDGRLITREAQQGQTVAAGYVWSLQTAATGYYAIVFSGGSAVVVNNTAAIADNVWHHLVVTWDGTTLRTYVDGTAGASSTAGTITRNTATDIVIGNAHDSNAGGTTTDHYAHNGVSLDEAAFYGTALTSTRIAAHYNAGTASPASVTVPSGSVAITATAPLVSVGTGASISTSAGALGIDATAPAFSSDSGVTVVVPAGVLTIDAAAPAISVGLVISVPAGQLAMAAAPPVLPLGASVAVPSGAVTLDAAGPVFSIVFPSAAFGIGVAFSAAEGASGFPSALLGIRASFSAQEMVSGTFGVLVASTGASYVAGGIASPFALPASPVTVDLSLATYVSTDPALADGPSGMVSIWYSFTSNSSSDWTFTWTQSSMVGIGMEIWAKPPGGGVVDPSTITLIAHATSGPPTTTMTASLGEGVDYFLRIHPVSSADNAAVGTLTYSTAARVGSGTLALQVISQIIDTPGWLQFSVSCATSGGTVNFSLDSDPTVIYTDTADAAGQLILSSAAVQTLSVGSHSLVATDVTGGTSGSQPFTVADSVGTPTPVAAIAAPVAAVTARWQLYDPHPGGELYPMSINPTQMTPPHSAKVMTSDHTTDPLGQPIIFEGFAGATQWTWTGTVLTQEQIDAMERFHALQRRFWVIDHLFRAWLVTWETLDWQEKRDTSNPLTCTYTAKLLIYSDQVAIAP